jgi:ABC-type multidrug transport system fused ATPase/permease subunit
MIADVSLLLIIVTGLFVVDPITALCTFVMFLFLGLYLYKKMHRRASELGILSAELSIKSNEKIIEVFSTYRESVVKNRRDFYAREIGKTRFVLSDVAAESAFMPYVSKYVIETAVVLGALFIGGIGFLMMDAEHAVGTLTIFLAAGTRIAPAMLRIQQSAIQIKSSIGQAKPTLEMIRGLGVAKLALNSDDSVHTKHEGFVSNIRMKNVTFSYPSQGKPAVSNISLDIPAGSTVAFVGPSGSGKTTIIDVLLGILTPQNGSVRISDLDPLEAISNWPGAIAYVPQDVSIISGSIRENVSLGYPISESSTDLIHTALEVAQLKTFVESLPDGLDTKVGERGAKLSGGQRQRLGIARAMFTKPKLLVLDEATSALDGETESNISEAIYGLRGQTTVVLIAHRLSTVMAADIVIYLSHGEVVASGKFDDLREMVPDFDNQAKLMGL